MKALSLQETGKLIYQIIDEPALLEPHEALVKVHRIGICGTDYHAYRGRQPFFSYPRILGHELGVEVLAIGNKVTNILPGDKCAVEPYLNCDKCQPCRNGRTNCCENLKVLGVHTDGGMTEFMKLPANKLYPSAQLSFEQLALVETLGIGCHAVNRSGITDADKVLVVGAGPIGLACLQFAKNKGAKVVMLDVNESRLAFAKNVMQADATVVVSVKSSEAIKAHFDGDMPTAIFDATGNPSSMMSAFELVAFGGKIIFVGLFQGDMTFFDPLFHRRELTILASRNALPEDFNYIIGLMEAGEINTNSWITHRIAFSDAADNFETLLKSGNELVKAIIVV
ncbi:zinc-binding alcohol dehydrogenase family protein [Emticicia sp. BO119]|uniref:zinc-binding alcohol dehydrogenase family protein n=1 Tax=Emticicia sp. BO119 TaxID=2757768 RepID=UPI0015F0E4CA|nr:zinc-binding alcohol dehydrogenase family protein [Emticicia sp. BO119]MBA4849553.1 zinc-binding alcohol dehydrogenase family protein [Emticicia sp. BO119]